MSYSLPVHLCPAHDYKKTRGRKNGLLFCSPTSSASSIHPVPIFVPLQILSVSVAFNSVAMSGIIGVLDGAISLVTFAADAFAELSKSESVGLRIRVGLDSEKGLSNAGGKIDEIRIYNENDQLLGSSAGGEIGSGEYSDFVIDQINKQQALRTVIVGGDDAVCVAFMTYNTVDAQYGWTGDWGCVCGMRWYYSKVDVCFPCLHPRPT